ncbi:MAG: hypothetical protein VX466_08800 [Myxococcota bacterium]|nr:hypothetical protein [Myxococcota bacterium]
MIREPGPWLWIAILVGTLARAWLLFGTAGTLDVDTWAGHAWEINQKGLIAYYHGGEYIYNHPPLMGEIFSRLYRLAAWTGVPFAVFLRAPFAVLDFGTALLLLKLLAGNPRRYAFFAGYWLLPLAIVFSSYHGNTDSALAFFLVAAVILVSRGRSLAAGAVLGIGLWIKFPAILALPALAFGFVDWKHRFRFVAATGAVGIATYLPALVQDAAVVIDSVFLYPGLQIQTPAGIRIWGTQLFFPDVPGFEPFARAIYRANTWICLLPVGFLAWARRAQRSPLEIAGNVGAAYAVFHGLTNFWAFQYLAWALPLWLVAGRRFTIPAMLVTTAYVVGLYVWLCDSWILAGTWDWMGRPHWPQWLLWLRDGCVLFFFGSALFLIVRDGRRAWLRDEPD